MDWKNQLTKTPILVLFIFLITVGVGTASALITITLAGNVHVTGDLEIDGGIFCPNCIVGFYWIESTFNVLQIEVDLGSAQRAVFCDEGDLAISASATTGLLNPATINQVIAGITGNERIMETRFIDLNLGTSIGVNGICADYPPAHVP